MPTTLPNLPNLAGTNVTPNVPANTLADTDITIVNQSTSLGVGADRQVTLAQLKAYMDSKAIAPVEIPVTVTTTWNGTPNTAMSSTAKLSRSSDGAWGMYVFVTTPSPPASWGSSDNAHVTVVPTTPNTIWDAFYSVLGSEYVAALIGPAPQVYPGVGPVVSRSKGGMISTEIVPQSNVTKTIRLTPMRDTDYDYTEWPDIIPAASTPALHIVFRYTHVDWSV